MVRKATKADTKAEALRARNNANKRASRKRLKAKVAVDIEAGPVGTVVIDSGTKSFKDYISPAHKIKAEAIPAGAKAGPYAGSYYYPGGKPSSAAENAKRMAEAAWRQADGVSWQGQPLGGVQGPMALPPNPIPQWGAAHPGVLRSDPVSTPGLGSIGGGRVGPIGAGCNAPQAKAKETSITDRIGDLFPVARRFDGHNEKLVVIAQRLGVLTPPAAAQNGCGGEPGPVRLDEELSQIRALLVEFANEQEHLLNEIAEKLGVSL